MQVKHARIVASSIVIAVSGVVEGYYAAAVLGMSAALAQYLYWIIQGAAWSGAVMAAIGGGAISGFAASAIVAYARRMALKQFITW